MSESETDIAHSPRHRACRGSSRECQDHARVSLAEFRIARAHTFIGRRGALVRLTFDACAESKVEIKIGGSVPARHSWRAREGVQRSMICREGLGWVSRHSRALAEVDDFAAGSDLEIPVRPSVPTYVVPADGAVVDDNVLRA